MNTPEIEMFYALQTTDTEESNFFMRLFNSNDKSLEMHLFLGALSILCIIFYEGYDLVYISKFLDPEDYGYGLAYAFAGIGAASWSQGVQRKFQKSKE